MSGGPLILALALLSCDGSGSAPIAADDSEAPDDDTQDTGEGCVLEVVPSVDVDAGVMPFTSTFSAVSTCAGGPVTFSWALEGEALGDGSELTQTWLASGEHALTVSATDGQSTASAVVTVQVDAQSCPLAREPAQTGTIAPEELDEASGLSVGRVDTSVLWSHNDGSPQLFALDRAGTELGRWIFSDAPEGDWEALSAAVDPELGALLLLGDVGDNSAVRSTVTVLLFVEPELRDEAEIVETDAWWSVELAYADGQGRNAEAMATDPVDGALYVFTVESDGRTAVHRAATPLEGGTLEQVALLELGDEVTGADFSPLGERIVMRTGAQAWVALRDQALSVWDAELCAVSVPEGVLGEGAAFDSEGQGFYSLGEGLGEAIWYTELAAPCNGVQARILAEPRFPEVGESVRFEVDSLCLPDGVASASWDLGSAGSSTETEPTALYLAAGEVPIAVDVVDGGGADVSGSTTLEVVPATCPSVGALETLGEVSTEEIIEASGLGASALNPGVLWTHNDAGDGPRLFAIDEGGDLLGIWTFDTPARDWEDLALGYDATTGAAAVFVGDVGDNGESRSNVHVLIMAEPEVTREGTLIEESVTEFSSITLTYPDGARNCETLMVDPQSGDLYLITKDYDGFTEVYRKAAPHLDGSSTELEFVADMLFGVEPLSGSGATTAGAFSPLGDRILIRTYTDAYMWHRDQAQSIAEALASEACDVQAPSERQGEAIDFTVDGQGYLTLSEGDLQPVFYTPFE